MTRCKYYLVFVIFFVFVSGCSSGAKLGIHTDYELSQFPEKSVIIGAIDMQLGNVLGISTLNAYKLNTSSGKKIYDDFKRNEYFYIALDPGEYTLAEIWYGYGLTGALGFTTGIFRTAKTFIARSGEVIYIGKLVITGSLDQYGNIKNETTNIIDDYDGAESAFRRLFPRIKKEVIAKVEIRLNLQSPVH